MEPQQQISADELFKIIGELTAQVRVANQMIVNLQQENEKLKKAKDGKTDSSDK